MAEAFHFPDYSLHSKVRPLPLALCNYFPVSRVSFLPCHSPSCLVWLPDSSRCLGIDLPPAALALGILASSLVCAKSESERTTILK